VNSSRYGAGKGARFVGVVVAIVASALLSVGNANAQASGDSVAAPSTHGRLPGSVEFLRTVRGSEEPVRWATLRARSWPGTTLGRDLRGSPGSFDDRGTVVSQRPRVPTFAASPAGRHRSTGRKVLGGVIGAVGGFFAGAYVGAAIEGQGCGCDDPGLKGAMIGAPIGTVAGAVLGVRLF
jgi:hypothetical protein